jgi:hypothetical protein
MTSLWMARSAVESKAPPSGEALPFGAEHVDVLPVRVAAAWLA